MVSKLKECSVYEKSRKTKISCKFVLFYKIYFDFLCVLFLSPFRIVYNKNSEFRVYKNSVHKFGCSIVHASALLVSLFWVNRDISGTISSRPEQLFIISNYICWVAYVALFVRLQWSNSTVDLFKISERNEDMKVVS